MTTDRQKKQMTRARALLKRKEYGKARKILKRVDHPTARKWLAKLDEIAPEKKRGGVRAFLGALVLVTCGLCSVAVFVGTGGDGGGTQPETGTATITNTPLPTATITNTPLPTATDNVTMEINGHEYQVTYDDLMVEVGAGTEIRACPEVGCEVVLITRGDEVVKLGQTADGDWWAVLDDQVRGFVPADSPAPEPTARPTSSCPYSSPTCGQLSSCSQARACLRAGHRNLDRDSDGIPCENLCN